MEDKPEAKSEAKSELPDMFAFGGYQLDNNQLSLLAPPAPPPITKPQRMGGLVKAANALMKPPVRDGGRYGGKVGLLQLVVQRIRERLEEERVWSCTKVEYVSQLQHYPHYTHCDFALMEMDKAPFVKVVADRFVKEFMKARAANRGIWFVVPTLSQDVEFTRLFEFGGVVMRGLFDYQIETDQYLVRLDCMWAVTNEESLICQTPQVIGTESGDGQTRRG